MPSVPLGQLFSGFVIVVPMSYTVVTDKCFYFLIVSGGYFCVVRMLALHWDYCIALLFITFCHEVNALGLQMLYLCSLSTCFISYSGYQQLFGRDNQKVEL